jgi:hypothetical protein
MVDDERILKKGRWLLTGFEPQAYHLLWGLAGVVCKGTAFIL